MSANRFPFSCYLLLLVLSVSLFHFCSCDKNFKDVLLCMDDERQALAEFKHGLVDDADRLASWVEEKGNSDCCKWAGIVCDNVTRHVLQIHLRALDGRCENNYDTEKANQEASKQRLRGNLSSSLLRLKQLRHLDLSCNDFGGIRIPKFVGSLGNLRYLNLSYSEFGVIIPPQLGNLSELHVLSLQRVDHSFLTDSPSMSSVQWLSSLRRLHHLDMSGIDLSKAIDWFHVINTLPSLVQLHLSACQLSDIYPHVASVNLTSLSLLNLAGNHFDSPFPQWVFSITSLVSLDLSRCNLHGPIEGSLDGFRNLSSLELLHVSHNDFMNSSLIMKGLSSSNLVSLDISSCSVSSLVLESLRNLTSLLSLDMSHNQLTKSISKSLGNFCNLRDLCVSNVDLSISLAHFVESLFECKFPSLESLDLTQSGLYGHLPDQLGQFLHLRTLDLGLNLVSGEIPASIGQLSFLRKLHLSSNLISGHIPNSIGQLSSLEELDLSNNQLNGSLPESLNQLLKLESLDFSNNMLSGVVTEAHFDKLACLKYLNGGIGNNLILKPRDANWIPNFQLHTLYLNSWGLGPEFPLWLQSQRDLKELDISNTRIYSPMPDSFWRSLPYLTYLDMSRNHIQGTLLSIPARLEVLDLNSNEFRGELPTLSNNSFIWILDLSSNSFVGSLHRLLFSGGVWGVEVVNLGNNHLSGIIPECWENWPMLSFLNLENNDLSGRIPITLGFSSQLESLNLHGNKLMGRLPTSLINLTQLEILQLGRNERVGSIPTWFGKELSFLKILNLRSNNFEGDIPHELCYLTQIQILDLAHNNLSGTIPRCFNNFSVLSGKEVISKEEISFFAIDSKEVRGSDSLVMKGREDTYNSILGLVMLLDLSSNNFVGHVPSDLTNLVKLKSLNLSRNQLNGRIPENVGDMKSLETFDLSVNNLSGELPMSLSSLNFLLSFNVSYNNFTGKIPSSTQLQSFNESSFLGNKLCGDPLIDHCVQVEVPNYTHQEEEDDDDDESHGEDWGFIISMVCGFILGFWIIVAPLIVIRSWRIAYFRFLNELRYMVYDAMHKYCFNMFFK